MGNHQNMQGDASERPSRTAKSQAMESAIWRGAAPQGRKRVGSSSPPRVSQSAKKVKSTQLPRLPVAKKGKISTAGHTKDFGQPKKVSRKRPVPVASDEDEDLQPPPSQIQRRKSATVGHHKRHVPEYDDESSNSGTDKDDHSNNSEDEYTDDGENDLQELDDESLVSALAYERARWSLKTSDDKKLSGDDSVSEVELTTASEIDERPFDDEEQEEVEVTEADHDAPPCHSYKVSKRELMRRAEVPTFSQDVYRSCKDVKPRNVDHEELSSDDAAITSPVNKGWHLEAQYNPPKGGARIISIKAQPTSLQAVIKAAIREVVGDALFVTAYPNAVTATNYYCDVLKKRAEKLHNVKLHDRFEKDHQFALAVRLSNFRCTLKRAAASEVKGFYQLIPGDACKERVKKLLQTTEYIYPRHYGSFASGREDGLLVRHKPFHHACIISLLKEWAFTSTRGASLGEKHAHRFTSSVSNGPQATERELPMSMICLVATAIHASLDDWSEGCHTRTDFNADLYEDVYKGHESVLIHLRKTSPDCYHRLMADLFDAVSYAPYSLILIW